MKKILKYSRSFQLGGMKSKMKTNQDVPWEKKLFFIKSGDWFPQEKPAIKISSPRKLMPQWITRWESLDFYVFPICITLVADMIPH